MAEQLQGSNDTQYWMEYTEDEQPRTDVVQVTGFYSPPKKDQPFQGKLPSNMYHFIHTRDDTQRFELWGVLDLVKQTIHNLLIQITHTTGRYTCLGGNSDRAKKNVEIMFHFEIYGIME